MYYQTISALSLQLSRNMFIVSFLRLVFLLVIFTFHASFSFFKQQNGVVVNNIISIIILIELGLSYSIAEFSNLIGELFNWISERSNWIAELSNCALIELQSSPIE